MPVSRSLNAKSSLPSADGFTLVELLTAIAVAAVLATVAIPGFTHLMASNRLADTTNAIVNALHQARMQALRSNQITAFCGAAGAGQTDNFSSHCQGAIAAVYAQKDGSMPDTPLVSALNLPTQIHLGLQAAGGDNVTALRYGANGIARTVGSLAPYSGLVADIYTNDLKTDNHRCIYLSAGSAVASCSLSQNCPHAAPAACQ